MSASLVRKGLELFKDDIKSESVEDIMKTKRRKIARGTDKMTLIGTKKKGVKKKLRSLQKPEVRRKATVKNKKIKSAVESYWKSIPEDNTATNLEYMLRQTTKIKPCKSYQKIISHHEGRSLNVETEKPQEKSIFDESDFDEFAKEYHGTGTR